MEKFLIAYREDGEMKNFLVLNILMGIKNRESYRGCWNSSDLLTDEYISLKINFYRISWLASHIQINFKYLMPSSESLSFDKIRHFM